VVKVRCDEICFASIPYGFSSFNVLIFFLQLLSNYRLTLSLFHQFIYPFEPPINMLHLLLQSISSHSLIAHTHREILSFKYFNCINFDLSRLYHLFLFKNLINFIAKCDWNFIKLWFFHLFRLHARPILAWCNPRWGQSSAFIASLLSQNLLITL